MTDRPENAVSGIGASHSRVTRRRYPGCGDAELAPRRTGRAQYRATDRATDRAVDALDTRWFALLLQQDQRPAVAEALPHIGRARSCLRSSVSGGRRN